jgi:threonine/homoserine/homoserine lactone efflux protein
MNESLPELIHGVLPLTSFALVMSITPGPNNFMLLSSGSRFGLRRSMPHLLGVTCGFIGLLLAAFAGIGALLVATPELSDALTIASVLYLLWLSWQLLVSPAASSGDLPTDDSAARPMGWRGAFAFQFINPKAWGMAVTSVGIAGGLSLGLASKLLTLVFACALVNLPCILLWTLFGAAMRRHLQLPWVRRVFNGLMAAAIAGTAAWMLRPLLPRLF